MNGCNHVQNKLAAEDELMLYLFRLSNIKLGFILRKWFQFVISVILQEMVQCGGHLYQDIQLLIFFSPNQTTGQNEELWW